ncbi:hypothetical protein [Microbacterium aurantiacum]|uniref:hypothetical protein n=1 Tax=Microbacterium aurantiacum TaxID=162393 RepID=UPI001AC7C964|nr:hypothetical protein [Microbacterium chocolatum]
MNRTAVIKTAGVGALVLALGVAGGAAVATVPTLLAPQGLSAGEEIATTPMPAPKYSMNAQGESYGTVVDARSPDEEPDLIQAEARNGQVGYVRKSELDAANGSSAMKTFKSPEEALAWQRENEGKDVVIPVYLNDGVTIIGDFIVTSEPSRE